MKFPSLFILNLLSSLSMNEPVIYSIRLSLTSRINS